MESVKGFVRCNDNSGSGDGSGFGDGSGNGSGYGSGDGSGYGYGFGDGFGDGDGSGYGDGIKAYNGRPVYSIDGLPTLITIVKRDIAKGFLLNGDLTLTSCYVAKGQGRFAHGKTIREAVQALQEKIFEDMDAEEAIGLFLEAFPDADQKYPARDFYIWHHRLTGSCEMGRDAFVQDGGYDLDRDAFTVREFIGITRDAYGGEVIRQLEAAYGGRD